MRVASIFRTAAFALAIMASTAAAGEVLSQFNFDNVRFRAGADTVHYRLLPIDGGCFTNRSGVDVDRRAGAPNLLSGGFTTGMGVSVSNSAADMVGFQFGHMYDWAMADFLVSHALNCGSKLGR